jgi:hypothetical protein
MKAAAKFATAGFISVQSCVESAYGIWYNNEQVILVIRWGWGYFFKRFYIIFVVNGCC